MKWSASRKKENVKDDDALIRGNKKPTFLLLNYFSEYQQRERERREKKIDLTLTRAIR